MPPTDPADPAPSAYEPPEPERAASASPTEQDLEQELPGGSRASGHDPYAALRYPDYMRFALGSAVSVIGQQMLAVAVGWELYERTHSATALGLVGLVQALPIIVLALPAGHAADLWNRKRIVLVTQLLVVLCSAGLAWSSYAHESIPNVAAVRLFNSSLARLAAFLGETGCRFVDPAVPVIFGVLLLMGVTRAFGDPARSALLPRIIPMAVFRNAVTWSSSGFQIACMVGPALGGFLLAQLEGRPYSFATVYLADSVCALAMFSLFLPIAAGAHDRRREAITWSDPAAGLRFVWNNKIILATITLDMFAVLFGGATALLPIYAHDILHSDASGLGWLRAAPSVGAFITALLIAHLPPMRQAGKTLLWAVVGFGVATIVFGLSRSFWLSFLMLLLTGAFDNVSVVVRHTLVQVLTPDRLRGRVSAINYVFIGTSNELGAFESGVTAAVFGPVLSVVGGGFGTILVVIAVVLLWPQVRALGPLDAPREGH
jgi:MFS family permease